MAVCEWCGVAIRTASLSEERSKSSAVGKASADEKRFMRSDFGSQTAVSSHRGTLPSTMLCACTLPIVPMPIIPSLTDSIDAWNFFQLEHWFQRLFSIVHKLLTHASHPDPFAANDMPPTYDSMH